MVALLWEVLVVLALLAVNGLLAMSEMALISARRQRLQQRADEGDKGARQALALSDSPAHFLSTIQIGMTLVGLLSGAYGGATLSRHVADLLAGRAVLSPKVAAILAIVLVVSLLTYASVILGELVPKRLALRHPEAIARLVSRPVTFLASLSFPLVWCFSRSTELVLRLLGLNPDEKSSPVTHEEIRAMVEQGAQEGALDGPKKFQTSKSPTDHVTKALSASTTLRFLPCVTT